MIELEDGSPAKSALEARQRWFRHFSTTLKAEPMDLRIVTHNARQTENLLFRELLKDGHVVKCLAPTESYLQVRNSKKRTGRAAGTDGLVGEFYRAAAESASQIIAPILAKAAWALSSPLASSGSRTFPRCGDPGIATSTSRT